MVCGAVPTGGQVSVYVSADASKAGTFHYVRSETRRHLWGTTVYVDQKSDGPHQIVSWSEVISSASATKKAGRYKATGHEEQSVRPA